MLSVLSPAKTLDFDSPLPRVKATLPRLPQETNALISVLREKSPADLRELMGISEELAELNVDRFRGFEMNGNEEGDEDEGTRPAVFAFDGPAYRALEPSQFGARDFTEAQKTLRLLSGLYGVLRPLDAIQPHRLEMGTRLQTGRGKDLYSWWGAEVTNLLNDDLDKSPGSDVLVNLASAEYWGVVDANRLNAQVISPRFEDVGKSGVPRVVSFYAKQARGMMAGWLIRNRVRTPGKLKDFALNGYLYDESRSTKSEPIFVRAN